MKLHSQVAAGVLATIAMLLLPSIALAQSGGGGGGGGGGNPPQPPQQPEQAPATFNVKVKGLHNGKATVGDRVEAIVNVKPFVSHQKIEIKLQNGGDTVA